MFAVRSEQEEIMDDLDFEGEVLGQTLHELEIINKWLGGNDVTINALFKVVNSTKLSEFTLADLGCGSGEMLKIISNISNKKKLKAKLTGIDANDYVIRYAKDNCNGYSQIELRQLNVFSDDFKSLKFDIITCTLFVHHFSDEELIDLLSQLKNQISTAIIINDIHRHWLAYYSIKILTGLFSRSYMVKYDAQLSVLRAFTRKELERITKAAGFSRVEIKWKWAFRYQVILWK